MRANSVRGLLCVVLLCVNTQAAELDGFAQKVVKVFAFKVSKKDVAGGSGTGFVLNREGYIATNNHVVEGRNLVFILLDGQRTSIEISLQKPNVEVVWTSPDLDLAILKVKDEALDLLNLEPAILTDQIPGKGRQVKALGFPGVADTLAVKTQDFTAESTFTSGDVGRLIEDGFWRKGGQTVRLVQHSAFIHGGNSGGPLIDECDRVVGVNTAAPVDFIKDGKGRVIGAGSLAGYYYASEITELLAILNNRGITYNFDGGVCQSPEAQMESLMRRGLVGGAIAVLLLGLLVVYAARRPRTVVVDGPSLAPVAEPERAAPVHVDTVKVDTPAQARKSNVVLDGYGGSRVRIVISSEELQRGEVRIGRDPESCDYTVSDAEGGVSRAHCSLSLVRGELLVRDLNSLNGTFVNGRQIEGVGVLNDGADLKLGSVSFRVIAG
ncbi:MAG: trypsin-like peptidase domain-containing protein [Pseudomonadota bacterium]